LKFGIWHFSNDLKWTNSRHESCRFWEVMELCSLQLFYLKSYCQWKSNLNLLNLKFKFCKWPQMGKLQHKVVDLRKFWNFLVEKFWIWIRLKLKNDLHSVWYNMSRMKTGYRCIWVCSAVVEEASREDGGCGFESWRPRSIHVVGWKSISNCRHFTRF
jgi:hypothetical protein